jgi:hypothetical protein
MAHPRNRAANTEEIVVEARCDLDRLLVAKKSDSLVASPRLGPPQTDMNSVWGNLA